MYKCASRVWKESLWSGVGVGTSFIFHKETSLTDSPWEFSPVPVTIFGKNTAYNLVPRVSEGGKMRDPGNEVAQHRRQQIALHFLSVRIH